jgi:diguanylate cyclase (GGDEF)-like protein
VFAWVLTIAYLAVGWWAPIVLALVAVTVVPALGTETVDPLTKLPNLRTFERLAGGSIARTRRGLAVGGLLLMIDLDGFGEINKRYGFTAGNEALAEVGRRLGGLVRATDLVARLGGDEFAAWFSGPFDAASAIALGERIEHAIKGHIATSAAGVEVGASIGLVIVRAEGTIPNLATLLQTADMAMQAQKRGGGGVRLVAYEDGKTEVSEGSSLWDRNDGGRVTELPPIDNARSVRLMISFVAAAAAVFVIAALASVAHVTP